MGIQCPLHGKNGENCTTEDDRYKAMAGGHDHRAAPHRTDDEKHTTKERRHERRRYSDTADVGLHVVLPVVPVAPVVPVLPT